MTHSQSLYKLLHLWLASFHVNFSISPVYPPNGLSTSKLLPTPLMVTDVGDTHATLEWTLNTPNDKPESFVVTCVPDEASPHTTTINVTVQLEELTEYTTQETNLTYQLTRLQEYTDYNYTCFLTAKTVY